MQYRDDKRAGRELSALGLGCMRLPLRLGKPDLEATEKIVLRALELGVNYFDTAYSYPGSEDALGQVAQRNGIRDRMLIATTLPHTRVRSIDDAERLFSTSLARLRTDHVDYYLIHNLVTLDQWQRLVDMGIVQWIALFLLIGWLLGGVVGVGSIVSILLTGPLIAAIAKVLNRILPPME